MNSYIIKRWKEHGMEKVGFYDQEGKFHMLFGVASDWSKGTIRVQNNETGEESFYVLEDVNDLVHVPWD